jgi:hypothetical protein
MSETIHAERIGRTPTTAIEIVRSSSEKALPHQR